MAFRMCDLQRGERTGTFPLVRVTCNKRQTLGVCPRAAVTSVSGAAVQITHSCSDAHKSSCLS